MSAIAPALLRPARIQRYRLVGDASDTVPRPHDAPQAHAAGLNPDRVLLFGNGISTGVGVGTQDLALPGQLARALGARTGRGCDVDLLADQRWDIESAVGALAGHDLSGYDAVVVVLGESDAYRLLPERRWTRALSALLDHLESRTSPGTGITVLGIPPISSLPAFRVRPGDLADRWADQLDECSQAVCAGRPRAHFVDAPLCKATHDRFVVAEEHRYRTPEGFSQWARRIASQVAPSLDAQSGDDRPARVARNRPQSVERRLATLWELRILDTPRERRFDEIVQRAQQMFGTLGAAFTLIDDHRQWNKATVGFEATEAPLEQSLCKSTIAQAGPLVIEDTRTDDRTDVHDSPMRFYAGYPVEASDGTRIGALCVFDSEPRDASTVDVTVLRDLALAIQRELAVVAA